MIRFKHTPQLKNIRVLATHGYHNISYVEWGTPQKDKAVLCLHGFSRNGRDFDYLAQELVDQGYWIICPDMPGRGKSDWLPIPTDYNYPKHASEIMTLLARLDVEHIDLVGTSMGGIMGMVLASFPNNPIHRLVMNDVGPYLPSPPQQRIREYLGLYPIFNSRDKAKNYLKQLLSPFGIHTEEHLEHAMENSYFLNTEGHYQLSYDNNILVGFTGEETDLWNFWETVNVPVLVIRGERSELLTLNCVDRMTQKKNVDFVEFPNVGHAPALNTENQIRVISQWLNRG